MPHELDEAWLRQQLLNASERFADTADLIEEGKAESLVGFLRASAARYKIAAEARDLAEKFRMEFAEAERSKVTLSRQFYGLEG